MYHSMAKHYRIAQTFIRMLASNKLKEVQVRSIGTDNNPADTFKPLATATFVRHCLAIIGPQDAPGSPCTPNPTTSITM